VFTASTLRETRILRVWEVDIAWVSGAKAEPLLQKDLWDGVLGRASRVLPIQSEDSIGVNISPPTGCHLPPIGLRITVSSSETSAIGDYFKTPKAKTP
jgi:hypothetical protein